MPSESGVGVLCPPHRAPPPASVPPAPREEPGLRAAGGRPPPPPAFVSALHFLSLFSSRPGKPSFVAPEQIGSLPPASGSPPAAFAARPAAGRAHVSAGGAGVQGRSLRVAPLAAVGAPPTSVSTRTRGPAAHRLGGPGGARGRGAAVGCLVSASPHPERGLFSRGRRGTDLLFSLLLTPPPALRRWAGAARPGLGVGVPGPRRGERGGRRRSGAQLPGLAAARPALPARGGSATPRPALPRPSVAGSLTLALILPINGGGCTCGRHFISHRS